VRRYLDGVLSVLMKTWYIEGRNRLRSVGMPIYEYICKTCGAEFQKRVSFSESDVLPTCPDCQSEQTQKKLSIFCAPGISGGGGSCAGCSGGSCSSCGGH
jgi:putative FmdB family regulatory protein